MTLLTAQRPVRSAMFPLWTDLKTLHAVWRQRQTLREMDDRTLSDIGVSRAQALTEAARPIWDAPETWRA